MIDKIHANVFYNISSSFVTPVFNHIIAFERMVYEEQPACPLCKAKEEETTQ